MTKHALPSPTMTLAAAGVALVASQGVMPAASAAEEETYSATELAAASSAVRASDVPGIAWHTDPETDKVIVTADATVSGAEIAKVRREAGDNAGAIEVNKVRGRFQRFIGPGDAIYGGGARCSLGFNVRKGSSYYFLTAGHCAKSAGTWYADPAHTKLLGSVQGYSFPGNDYALIKYANPASIAKPGGFRAANAVVGERVTRDGSTTGVHSGTVKALNVSVNYGSAGVVNGLIQTNVCAEPGDSGGALYDGSKALGLTSGGSGDCTSGGTTFYQPVVEAANRYGVSVY